MRSKRSIGTAKQSTFLAAPAETGSGGQKLGRKAERAKT